MQLINPCKFYLSLFKEQSHNFKHRYTSRTRGVCQGCGKEIYITYKQVIIKNVFCKSCWPHFYNKVTAEHAKYMYHIKSKQLELSERTLNQTPNQQSNQTTETHESRNL